MSTNAYHIAYEHATNEIAEINAQIQKLTRRKELLENLLEPIKLLVAECDSVAIPATILEVSESESPATEAAEQESPVVVSAQVSETGPDALQAPSPMMQPEVEETNLHTCRNGGSISHKDVAGLAYRFWKERGQVHGHHEADWLRAAQELQQCGH